MIKVCHFTSAHMNTDNRILEKECKSLAKNGYQVYLVGAGNTYTSEGVQVIGISHSPKGRIKRVTRFAKSVYRVAKELNCDIYHFHDPELLPYGLKLKKLGKIVVFDSHEKYSEQIAVKEYLRGFAPLIARLYSKYENHVLRKIDGVVFPCLINGVDPFHGMCKHTEIIGNYPKLEELYNEYEEAHEKVPRTISYIGSLTQSRGITLLKNAAEKAGVELVLAGDFSSGDYRNEILASKNVSYLGHLNRSEVAKAIQDAEIGMSLLRNIGQYYKIDTLSTKIYEYMSLGVPVIMQNSPYSIKVNEKYSFGICVNPEDEDEVVEAIMLLINNPELRRQYGENGRKAVREEFNWSVEEKKLLGLYNSCVEDGCIV